MVFSKNTKGYTTPRAIIPKTITNEMGITEVERDYKLKYDKKKKIIIISKK
ncbi:MAG: hypothetical protein ACRC0G_11675 [Fusobacteriaceae bacterium]